MTREENLIYRRSCPYDAMGDYSILMEENQDRVKNLEEKRNRTEPEKDPIRGSQSGITNPHQASRDKLAQALIKYQDSFGVPEWEDAAYWFESSGQMIQTIVEGFLEDVRNMSFGDSEKYIPSFQKLREYEEYAFRIMLQD